MIPSIVLDLRPPYLIFLGDVQDPLYAKTAFGIVHWRRELVSGQWRFAGRGVDLGVPDLSIEMARQMGVRSLIVGVAPPGGAAPASWWQAVEEAVSAGLDVVCGLHLKLHDRPEIVAAAERSGARLVDVRMAPPNLSIGSGKPRSGRRLLTAGTDCAVGKKYSSLALHAAFEEAGMRSTFRATGQTGIMIAGSGIPIDSVVADFISGAAELLSPANDSDHWDVIEGQGSLFHPAYAGVSLGLLHGSQPDAIVVCHQAERRRITGWPDFPIPSIPTCIERNLLEGRTTSPDIRCVGICVNTSGLPHEQRSVYLASIAEETSLPCVDPLIDGCRSIADYVRTNFH